MRSPLSPQSDGEDKQGYTKSPKQRYREATFVQDTGVVPISFQEENVGKHISQTKKRYWWKLSLEGEIHEVCLATSRLSGKKSITVNGRMQYEEVTPLARLWTFAHSWNVGEHSLSIIPTWAVKETVYRSFDLSIDGILFAHLLEGERPSVTVPKLIIKISSAKGLRSADWTGKSDPYCTCEIPGKRGSKIQTAVINKTTTPAWNHEHTIADYTPGDPLNFVVMDKDVWPKTDDVLGKATLAPEQFYPWGFTGWLKLDIGGQSKGQRPMLKIEILVPDTPQEQSLREMFDRCDQNKDGTINKRELIKILRIDQEVADFFQLPRNIRQEDGSRDSMEKLFQEMDKDGNREVGWEEFRAFFSRRPEYLATSRPTTPETKHASPSSDVPRPRAGSSPGPRYASPRSPRAASPRASASSDASKPVSPIIRGLQKISMSPPALAAAPGEMQVNGARRSSELPGLGIGLLEARPKQTASRRRATLDVTRSASDSPTRGRSSGDRGKTFSESTVPDSWGGFHEFGTFPGSPPFGEGGYFGSAGNSSDVAAAESWPNAGFQDTWPDTVDADSAAKEVQGFSAAFGESCTAAFSDLSQWGATESTATGDDAGSPLSPMPSSPGAADSPSTMGSQAACNLPAVNSSPVMQQRNLGAIADPPVAEPRSLQPESSPSSALRQIGVGFGAESIGGLCSMGHPQTPLFDPWGYAYSGSTRLLTSGEQRLSPNGVSSSPNSVNRSTELVDPWGYRYSGLYRFATPCQ